MPFATRQPTMIGPAIRRDGLPNHIVAIVNPSKPRWEEGLARLQATCLDAGLPVPVIRLTTVQQAGGPQARHALAERADLVIAMGGDGTVREVAQVLAGTGVPLGIVPLGTANLFSRNLGMRPRDIQASIHTALGSRFRDIDLGVARMRQHADEGMDVWTGEHLFLVLAGMGHDASTVLETRDDLKARVSWLAYFESGARHMLKTSEPVRVSLDGGTFEERPAWSVIAANCGRIPAGIDVIPNAIVDDGFLDIALVEIRHLWQWLPIAAKGLLKFRPDVPGLQYHRAREAAVVPHSPQPVELDGDVFEDVSELRVSIRPRTLRVAIPKGFST